MRAAAALAAGILATAAAPAGAIEYRSVGEAAAVLYDAPSAKAVRQYVISPGSPVEVLAEVQGWVKVRDAGGRLAWAEAKAIDPRRTVVVTEEGVLVRGAASDSAEAVFRARRGLVLELLEPAGAWARVRHRDGLSGYARVSGLWGL